MANKNPSVNSIHRNPVIDKSVKLIVKTLAGYIGFSSYGDEYQQSLFRLAFTCIFMVVVHQFLPNMESIAYILGYAYILLSLIILLHTRTDPTPNPKRQIISMLGDVSLTSLALYYTNDVGGIFVGVFLWLVIGYGFRFGKTMLITTYIASLTGFTVASLTSTYWQNHMIGFYGLLFTLFTIPIYALTLLNKLKEATRKAEAANRAKSEFLSHISHEIRTPLNGIVGACNLLEASNLNKNHQTLFNVVKSSSNLLLELVNNVLDLSKIENGKVVAYQEDFHIQELVVNTVNLFESQARHKHITLAYDIEKDTPLRVHGNLLHTKQVLINLVGNAVKFTKEGSVKIRISSSEQTNSHAFVRFEVIDTGIGIAKESLSNIFESFVQAEESIKFKFGGTGLGTTISKNLVELMHGEIGVESELGKGSTFWFEIPLERLSTEPAKSENIASEVIPFKKSEANAKKKSYRILVAEDNDTNILIISQMLTMANHKFDIVKNGQLALEMLRDNTYDLMMLDYQMPEMGGLEALKIYQAINIGLPQVPAVILTADATEATRQQFESLNIAGFLTKPIRIEALSQAIDEAVSKSPNKAAEVVQYNEIKKQEKVENTILLDTSRLNDLAMISKSPTFVENLIKGFISDTDQNLTRLKSYVMDGDYPNINDCGHTVAGSASNIGATDLAKTCRIINHIKPTDKENVEVLLSNALDSYNKTKVALMHYLDERSGAGNQASHLKALET